MIVFLLCVIAFGVLICSEVGQLLLWTALSAAIWITGIALGLGVLAFSVWFVGLGLGAWTW